MKDAFYFPFGETTTIIPGSYDANVVEKASLYQQPPYEFDSVPVTSVTSDLASLDETDFLPLKNDSTVTSTSQGILDNNFSSSSSYVTTLNPPITPAGPLGRNSPEEGALEVTLDESSKVPLETTTTTSVSLAGNLTYTPQESSVTVSTVNNNQQESLEVKSTDQTGIVYLHLQTCDIVVA